MTIQTPLCWICNKEKATTREHLIKRSDVKDQLGNSLPLYFHKDNHLNKEFGSLNSKTIKFEKSICDNCNSTKTQPHDLAWEKLSYFLRNTKPRFKKGNVIRAKRVFPYMISKEMLNVHLYFVKWIGCEIIKSKIAIEPGIEPGVETFSQSIMNEKAHPNIWLAFGIANQPLNIVGASRMDAAHLCDATKYDYLCRFYNVGPLSVRVRFCSRKIKDDWHPNFTNRFTISDFGGPVAAEPML